MTFACGHLQCVVWGEAKIEPTSPDKCSICQGTGAGREELQKLRQDIALCAQANGPLKSRTAAVWFGAVSKWLQTMPQPPGKLTVGQLHVLGNPEKIIAQVVEVLKKEEQERAAETKKRFAAKRAREDAQEEEPSDDEEEEEEEEDVE